MQAKHIAPEFGKEFDSRFYKTGCILGDISADEKLSILQIGKEMLFYTGFLTGPATGMTHQAITLSQKNISDADAFRRTRGQNIHTGAANG